MNRHPEYPDYAVIVKRRNVSREERGPGFYSGQGVSVDQLSQPASSPRMQSSPQLRNSASETGSADLPQYGSGVEGCVDSPLGYTLHVTGMLSNQPMKVVLKGNSLRLLTKIVVVPM